MDFVNISVTSPSTRGIVFYEIAIAKASDETTVLFSEEFLPDKHITVSNSNTKHLKSALTIIIKGR